MRVERCALPGLLRIVLERHRDDRGDFSELYRQDLYRSTGIGPLVQDNLSRSAEGVLRGLHFQHPAAQGKLVQVLHGAVWDVAVDLRRGSPGFGRWEGMTLDEDGPVQLWVPPGFAHGFLSLAPGSVVLYRCTEYRVPAAERRVRWDDPDLAIAWPRQPRVVSALDAAAPLLRSLGEDELPAL